MKTIILSRPSKTSRQLARSLDIPIYYHSENIPYDTELIIRYGNTSPIYSDIKELNSRESIQLASNKKLTREVLAEFDIPVPVATETDFPVIARPSYHEQGNDFFVCYNDYDIENAKENGCTYFSKYYPKTKEYRVHVANNKTLLMSVKENGDTESIVWNYHKTGFTLRHLHRSDWLYNEDLLDIVKMAKRSVRILGLDFGSVDVMAFPTDNQKIAVVSEINTSPSLSPLALSKYANYFYDVISES